MSKKASFNMLFDETQKEILEYVIDDIYAGADVSKGAFIQWLIRDTACDILHLPDEDREGISDDMVLQLLKHESDEKQMRIIDFVGVEKYKESIQNWKATKPDYDSTYMENLLAQYLKRDGEING